MCRHITVEIDSGEEIEQSLLVGNGNARFFRYESGPTAARCHCVVFRVILRMI